MAQRHVDVLVVTALQLERRAVRAHLMEIAGDVSSGAAADIGVFEAGDRDISVAVIETGAGNVGASVLAVRAEEAFRPALTIMVGVAGGVKDVQIGDVIASSKVYWYEGGKQARALHPRPEFAPVSQMLVQLARAVAANERWQQRVRPIDESVGGLALETHPKALVAPVVVGEKVVADSESTVAQGIRAVFGDAVAVNMEDFGTLRGASGAERTKTIAIRGISDLLDDKARSDGAGSQPRAAANAAAFAFELIEAAFPETEKSEKEPSLAQLGAQLYPEGPQQSLLWDRAGGDLSHLVNAGTGFARWWYAVRLLENGGGGGTISRQTLLDAMAEEFPENSQLREIRRSLL